MNINKAPSIKCMSTGRGVNDIQRRAIGFKKLRSDNERSTGAYTYNHLDALRRNYR